MPLRRFLPFAVVALLLIAAPMVRAAEPAGSKLAHIKLRGDLDETPVATDSLFGAMSENFKDKLDRIKKASQDKEIAAVFLHFDTLQVGWGKIDELRRAIKDCQATGKKVYAYLEAGESKDYLLALSCDEVIMPESGTLMLTGMRAEIMFFKKLLENIHLKADVLQIGDFKGAAEPFVRTEMSPEVRKQLETVIDDFYDKSYVQPIVDALAKRSKATAADVKKIIDEGPYTAKKAKELKLIDRVGYADSIQEAAKKDLKAESVSVMKNYGQAKSEDLDLSNPFSLLKLLKPPTAKTSNKPKVAVIYATGTIVTGKGGNTILGGNVCGSTTMVDAIRQAEEDKHVKAIVLRVDSPGGSALASDLIWNELKRCKKPVVASMSDVAASGGYYICMPAQKIFAEPGTITGSIGVFGLKLVTGDLEKKVGLNTEIIKRGANSGLFSTDAPFSDSERKAMRTIMEDVYEQFVIKALEGRKQAGKAMTRADIDKLASGRIWTGRQAKENGLVDELGTLADAIAAAKTLAGTKEELEILPLPKPRSFLDNLLESRLDSRAMSALLRDVPGMDKHLRTLDALLRLKGERVLALSPYHFEVK
jgi:protease-4